MKPHEHFRSEIAAIRAAIGRKPFDAPKLRERLVSLHMELEYLGEMTPARTARVNAVLAEINRDAEAAQPGNC